MFFSQLIRRNRLTVPAHLVYVAIVERARDPRFFTEHGVPDTLDGRFEMIALHAFLVMRRLKSEERAQSFNQRLFDTIFADMDRNLREIGNGDLSVGKQVKRMATSFYGRIAAYQAGLRGDGDLDEALKRNLFGTVSDPDPAHLAWFVGYTRQQAAWLDTLSSDSLTGGAVTFAALPAAD